MAVINPPAWMQQGSYPANTDRLVLSSLVRTQGVVEGLMVAATPTPSMSITVSAGKAFIQGSSIGNQGMYNLVNDAPVTLVVPTSSATYSRIDLVIAQVQDADVAGSVNLGKIDIISGVPSSSPVAPTLPATSIILARITVPVNATAIQTSNISSAGRTTASLHGAMVPTMAVVTSTTRPTSPLLGQEIYETDTGVRYVWDGNAWKYLSGWSRVSNETGGFALTTTYQQAGTTSNGIDIPETGEYIISGTVGFNISVGANTTRLYEANLWLGANPVAPFPSYAATQLVTASTATLAYAGTIEFTRQTTLTPGNLRVRVRTNQTGGSQLLSYAILQATRLS